MSSYVRLFVNNNILWGCIVAWMLAQVLKVFFYRLIEHEWDIGRILGLGGMPSSHAAVVTALASSIGCLYGFDSALFAIAFVLAVIVMTDAAGVRRAAGKQAVVINQLVQDIFEGKADVAYEKLKELLGHSPFEVLIGGLLGIIVGVIFGRIL